MGATNVVQTAATAVSTAKETASSAPNLSKASLSGAPLKSSFLEGLRNSQERSGVDYLPPELRDHMTRNPGQILSTERSLRHTGAADALFEKSLRDGVDPRKALQTLEDQKAGRAPFTDIPLQPRNREIGSLVSEYDRVLNVHSVVDAIDSGRVRLSPDTSYVEIDRRYGSRADLDAAVNRSLRYLGAKPDQYKDLPLEQKELLEQTLISKRN